MNRPHTIHCSLGVAVATILSELGHQHTSAFDYDIKDLPIYC